MFSSFILTHVGVNVNRFHTSSFPVLLEQSAETEKLVARFLGGNGLIAYNKFQWYPDFSQDAKKTQEDVTLVHPVTGASVVIDVKARRQPFQYGDIAVGGVKKYTSRQYVTRAIVVVDDETGETRCTDYEPQQWTKASLGLEPSYLVPIDAFYSLETLVIKLTKQGYRFTIPDDVPDIVDVLEEEAQHDAYLAEWSYEQDDALAIEKALEAWRNR